MRPRWVRALSGHSRGAAPSVLVLDLMDPRPARVVPRLVSDVPSNHYDASVVKLPRPFGEPLESRDRPIVNLCHTAARLDE